MRVIKGIGIRDPKSLFLQLLTFFYVLSYCDPCDYSYFMSFLPDNCPLSSAIFPSGAGVETQPAPVIITG